jgi:hypothetical protein
MEIEDVSDIVNEPDHVLVNEEVVIAVGVMEDEEEETEVNVDEIVIETVGDGV